MTLVLYPFSHVVVYISEPRCGPLAGASGSPVACALTDVNDAPSSQFLPLVDRRPSVSMLNAKWGDRSTPTAAALRQGLSSAGFHIISVVYTRKA